MNELESRNQSALIAIVEWRWEVLIGFVHHTQAGWKTQMRHMHLYSHAFQRTSLRVLV